MSDEPVNKHGETENEFRARRARERAAFKQLRELDDSDD